MSRISQPMSDQDWVEVYIAQTPQEAHLIRSFLESQGMEAAVDGEHLASLQGMVPLHESFPSVQVRRSERQRAQAWIESFTRQPPSVD